MVFQSLGSEDAIRVVSLSPPPAKLRQPGSLADRNAHSEEARTCGRWLMWATISSCLSGSRVTTSAPRSLQNETTFLTARGSEASTGVTKQVLPSNRDSLPFSH